ncbi:N(6)-adenine-specific DNA methyltransferase 2 [Monoraphidium neglectum]|uniref:N(6)-adenine-specific DNA methyltransferase 2 n=1 Tax=Monoraphidium neglectum TaxID=145388 RepID=A0A0D2JLU6_9CHLO|nr:N(6)-adenine-specific DNA methyltransferase 2 [Monoraphidium neglectum]KIZ00168.1 N(6)-adenine-specific DNA methyltransferase 2 [Monoraphidium neglectum]|eukprot:XP_013899187.1 N(6)-adenine-specific DNA methyltransferase 2 [Monoraphidium neglectum]
MVAVEPQTFLERHDERADFNQYWYSGSTISALVQEILDAAPAGDKVAFLSTPSLFYSLPENAVLLDYDEASFGTSPAFVRYDYNAPEQLPEKLAGSCGMLVIDPPFITEPVWRQYARTAALLLAPGGRVICSTVAENAPLMAELFGATACAFKPAIPHLVYQYSLFCSYAPTALSQGNPEVPDE